MNFRRFFANKQTPPWMSLGGFHGLMLQKKITQKDYKMVTIFHFFFKLNMRTCVFGFQSLVDSFFEIGSFFSVHVGCVFDKLPSIKQQVFKSRKKIPFPKNQFVSALVF